MSILAKNRLRNMPVDGQPNLYQQIKDAILKHESRFFELEDGRFVTLESFRLPLGEFSDPDRYNILFRVFSGEKEKMYSFFYRESQRALMLWHVDTHFDFGDNDRDPSKIIDIKTSFKKLEAFPEGIEPGSDILTYDDFMHPLLREEGRPRLGIND